MSDPTPTRPEYSNELSHDRADQILAAFLARPKSENSRRAYLQALDDFSKFIGADSVKHAILQLLSADHSDLSVLVQSYKAHLLGTKLSSSTISIRLGRLRALIGLWNASGAQWQNISLSSIRNRPPPDRGDISPDEYTQVLAGINGDDAKACRDRVIVSLLHDLSLRPGELLALNIEDICFEQLTITTLRQGSARRQVDRINANTAGVLAKWCEILGTKSGPLIVNPGSPMRERLTGTRIRQIIAAYGEILGRGVLRPTQLRQLGMVRSIDDLIVPFVLAQSLSIDTGPKAVFELW